MNSPLKLIWNPVRLDVRAFAMAGQTLQSETPLADFQRLREDAVRVDGTGEAVKWQIEGEMRVDARGKVVPWLHLEAKVVLPLKCQRCLGPVEEPLEVDRWYRFVDDEAIAEQEDEDSEEDVLALEPRPDMVQLIEDELLMAMPLVPMHDTCPVAVPMQAGDIESPGGASTPRENPFAQLAKLKK